MKFLYALSLSTLLALFAGVAEAKTIAHGQFHTCWVMVSSTPGATNLSPGEGYIRCTGLGEDGQLGSSEYSYPAWTGTPPAGWYCGNWQDCQVRDTVSGTWLVNTTDIAAGARHTCAIANGGALYCWGSNAYGQLGDGTTVNKYRPTLIVASGATQVVAGNTHTCAMISGLAKCWGRNNYGQLGTNAIGVNQSTPTNVANNGPTVLNIRGLASGDEHVCALGGGGSTPYGFNLYCWGLNTSSQINASTGNKSSPTARPFLPTGYIGAFEAMAGNTISCGRHVGSGRVFCWGGNVSVGINSSSVYDMGVVPSVEAMSLPHFPDGKQLCKLATNASGGPELQCKGLRTNCRLGDGAWAANYYDGVCAVTTATTFQVIPLPAAPSNMTAFSEIASGSGSTCVRSTYGGLAYAYNCWGDDSWGQIGAGGFNGPGVPHYVPNLEGFYPISQ